MFGAPRYARAIMSDESQLSEREREILGLVATGATNQQIAQQLGIAVNTVKVHLRNIFGKINVVSRTEATLYAVRTGLVQLDPDTPAAAEPEGTAPAPTPAPAGSPDAAISVAEPALTVPEVTPTAEPIPPETTTPTAPPVAQRPPSPPRRITPTMVAGLVIVLGIIAALLVWSSTRRTAELPVIDDPEIPQLSERWRELASLPAPREAFGLTTFVIEDTTYLFAIGGAGRDGVSSEVWRYNPAGDRWVTTFSAKPTPVADIQVAVIGGRLLVPGGRAANGSVSTVFEAYDPIRDTWTTLTDLPAPRSRYALAALEGKLYLFGGWDGSTYRDEVWQYAPDNDTWQILTPLTTPRADADAVVTSGQIHLIGGENADGLLALNERYNPAAADSNTPWTPLATLLEPRARAGLATIGDRIFLFGGVGGNTLLYYNIDLDEWDMLETPLPATLRDLRIQPIGNKLYIVGGRSNSGVVDQVYEYQALYTIVVPIQ
jgi:DNA-binding CsgD family transcriptional regulator/N-acetylneuraminic acid mutarotase